MDRVEISIGTRGARIERISSAILQIYSMNEQPSNHQRPR